MALWRSSGTPLYPPIAGKLQQRLAGSAGERRRPSVSPWSMLWRRPAALDARRGRWPPAIALISSCGEPASGLRSRSWRSCVAEATGIALVVTTGAASHDIARYTWPLLERCAGRGDWRCSPASSSCRLRRRPDRARRCCLPPSRSRSQSPRRGRRDRPGATGVANVVSGDDDSLFTLDRFRYEYGAAQDSIPAGREGGDRGRLPHGTSTTTATTSSTSTSARSRVSTARPCRSGAPPRQTTDYLRGRAFAT